MAGAPTTWTEEKKTQAIKIILDRIIMGESVRKILHPDKRDKDVLPSNVEFLEWVDESEQLAKQYARAMDWRSEGLLEDTIEIADNTDRDIVEIDGIEQVNKEVIQRSKLRVEARQFAIGKMSPKKYGTKVDLTGTILNSAPLTIDEIRQAKSNLENEL